MLLYLVKHLKVFTLIFFFCNKFFEKLQILDTEKAKSTKRNKNFELNLLPFSLLNF